MKRNAFWLLGVFTGVLAIAAAPAFAARGNAIGMVVSLTGSGQIVDADSVTRPLALKGPVYLNDRIVTDAGAKLQVMLNDDTMLQQGPRSELILDTYVYSPEAKQDQVDCKMNLVRGAFRVLSGKITRLNPDRFKVKTRMATVGIRGCEVDFDLQTPKRDDVLVRWLPPDRTIVVKKDQKDAAGPDELVITKAGFGVSIQPGMPLFQQPINASQLRAMKDAVSRVPQNNTPAGTGGDSMPAGNTLVSTVVADALQGKTVEELAEDREEKLKEQVAATESISFTPLPTTGPTEAPPAAGSVTPTQPLPALMGGAPWTSWFWELDSVGTVAYGPNTTFGFGNLNSTDLAVLAGAGPAQTLSTGYGVNSAGAQLRRGADGVNLNGSCYLRVYVGGSASPTWDGSVSLADGAGSSLMFGMSGTIDGTGVMNGSIDPAKAPYELQFKGGTMLSQSDVTSQSIKGKLTGDGITGAAGGFDLGHRDGTTAKGGFGSDLSNAPY